MIRENHNQVKLTPFQKQELQSQILRIWMKMRRKCYRNAELVWPTRKVRRRSVSSVRNKLKRQDVSLSYRSLESSKQRASMSIDHWRFVALTIVKRFHLKESLLKGGTHLMMKRRQALIVLSKAFLSSKSSRNAEMMMKRRIGRLTQRECASSRRKTFHAPFSL